MRVIQSVFAIILLTAALAAPARAQAGGDEAAIDILIEDLYGSISGPPGAPRDFDLLRSLFLDGAVMGIAVPGEDATGRAELFGVEDYIARSGDNLVRLGFTESETRRAVWIWGGLATVHSAYEGVRTDTGETIATGINVLTLTRAQGDWKIASLVWRPADADWPVERGFEE